MSAQVFEAKSLEAALEQAAAALGVAVDELEHELVDEKAGDFWGLGDTVYSVRAWRRGEAPDPEQPEEEAAVAETPVQEADAEPSDAADADSSDTPDAKSSDASDAEPPEVDDQQPDPDVPESAQPAAEDADGVPDFFQASSVASEQAAPAVPADEAVSDDLAASEDVSSTGTTAEAPPPEGDQSRSPGADGEGGTDVSGEAIALLDTIFETIDFDCEAEARLDGETLQIAITGDDNQYLLDGRGRGLSALELILNHAFRHRPDRAHRRVRVDAGDFRSQLDDEIRDMAYQVAHQAKETSSPQQTGPLNPYERRIVHLTLAEDPKVKTRSIGNGFQKAVNVIPTDGGHRR